MDEALMLPGVTERELGIRRRVHRLAEFYRHVSVYIIVITMLWCFSLWSMWGGRLPNKWYSYWAIWPTVGWGIGLITHVLSVLPVWSFFSHDWEDKKVRELLGDGKIWAHWATIGWGIGLTAHGLSVFASRSFFGTEWEEKKVEEIMAREKLKVVSSEKQLMQAQMRMLQAQMSRTSCSTR